MPAVPHAGTCGAKIATAAQGCRFGWDAFGNVGARRGWAARLGPPSADGARSKREVGG